MQRLKFLVLAVGLFIQGCGGNQFKGIPGVEPKENEGVVVFSLCTIDSSVVKRGIIFDEIAPVYINSLWKNEQTTIKFSELDHKSVKQVKKSYIVAKVQAGSYFMSEFDTNYSYNSGCYSYLISIKSANYNKDKHPISFKIARGEVKYLGRVNTIKKKKDLL